MWSYEQQTAFETLIKAIRKDSKLRYYDINKPVTLQVDASSIAVGAALIQDGYPISFSSRALTKSQVNYHQIEKECLAIVFGCTKFHDYVYGADLTVESDHKPLETIFKKSISSCPQRLQAMRLRIQDYNPKVVYIPGSEMIYADLLSRDITNLEEIDVDINSVAVSKIIVTSSIEKLLDAANHSSSSMKLLREIVMKGWPDSIKSCDKAIRMYWPFRDELGIDDKYLCKGTRVIIPDDVKRAQAEMLNRLHEGHLGVNRTLCKAREAIFWPNMTKDIIKLIGNCGPCQKVANSNTKEIIFQRDLANLPWEIIAADIFELDQKYYLVVVDDFSGFVECAYLKDISSAAVISKIKEIFARFGPPQLLITDNGRQFVSEEFKSFCKKWDFRHTTSPYHAQSNGLAERAVQTVKQLFKKCAQDNTDPYLALLNFRNTARDTQLASPAERLFSRKLRSNLPVAQELLKPKLQKDVNSQLKAKREKAATYSNRGRKRLPELEDGEAVWVRYQNKWNPGRICHKDVERPRAYWVCVNGKNYLKNRYHLKSRSIALPDQFDENEQELKAAVPGADVGSHQETPVQTQSYETASKLKKSGIPKASPTFGKDLQLAKGKQSRYGRAIKPVERFDPRPVKLRKK